jgi:hypothetical protein
MMLKCYIEILHFSKFDIARSGKLVLAVRVDKLIGCNP